MKNFNIALILIFSVTYSFAQPIIQWQNTIGGSDDDELRCMDLTNDGGYIIGGESFSNISGDKTENSWGLNDYWVVKLDSSGNVQWENTIGGSNFDGVFSIEQTSDGGYILGGQSYSNISGDKTENSQGSNDYWIIKLDTLGNIQWQNNIGGDNGDYLQSIQQTFDGGYILGGDSFSNISGDKTENNIGGFDYWVVKLDSIGNIQWQNTIGGSLADEFPRICQTTDGGYFLGGRSRSNISGDKAENCLGDHDYWILKLDSSGSIVWQNTIGGNSFDNLQSIQQTIDNGYIIGGYSWSGISGDKTENSLGLDDYWIVKIDSNGNVEWENTIGGNKNDQISYVQQTTNDGYILGGFSNSDISGDKTEPNSGGDCWILKLDSLGIIQWQNTIGGSSGDGVAVIKQDGFEEYIIGGNSGSNISGDKTENCLGVTDYWVFKLVPDTITWIPSSNSPIPIFNIFPNPSTGNFIISFEGTIIKGKVEIVNILGENVHAEDIFNEPKKEINLKDISQGIYFVKVFDGERYYCRKIIVEQD